MKIKKYFFSKPTRLPHYTDGNDIPDALRYDCAFIKRGDPTTVLFPQFQTRYGNLGGVCTFERWRSFGIPMNPLGQDPLVQMNIDPREWVTYRQSNLNHNYVEFTLEEFLFIKDIHDLREEIDIRAGAKKCEWCGCGPHLDRCSRKLMCRLTK